MVETRITVGKDVINIPASPFILRVVGIGYREAVFRQIHTSHIL